MQCLMILLQDDCCSVGTSQAVHRGTASFRPGNHWVNHGPGDEVADHLRFGSSRSRILLILQKKHSCIAPLGSDVLSQILRSALAPSPLGPALLDASRLVRTLISPS